MRVGGKRGEPEDGLAQTSHSRQKGLLGAEQENNAPVRHGRERADEKEVNAPTLPHTPWSVGTNPLPLTLPSLDLQ